MPKPPTGYRTAAFPLLKPTAPSPVLPSEREPSGRLAYPLGAWEGGRFVFKSPAHEQQWHQDSFNQGSNHLLWMKGRRLRPEEEALAEMGLPRSDDVILGPDGARYQPTPESREDPHLMALRAAHLAAEPTQGSAFQAGQRATEKAMPVALKWMAQGGRVEPQPSAANDNRAAANDNATVPAAAQTKPTPANSTPPSDKKSPGIGRFAAMGEALARTDHHVPTPAEIAQDADDAVRLLGNAMTLDGTDKVAAASNALASLFTDETYRDAYRRHLADEEQKTAEARQRLGLLGAGVEAAPTFIPGYGDALGLAGDIKMYREHPEERTWKNAGMTAAGLLPFVPSAAGTIKKVDKALEAAEDGAKIAAKEGETLGESARAIEEPKAEAAKSKGVKSETTRTPEVSFSKNYPKTYYDAYPQHKGKGVIHRAIERQVLDRYPGLFEEAEIYALENLRGIPKELNNDLHLRFIRREMDKFYDMYPTTTREQILRKRDEIDNLIGHLYLPTGKSI